MVWDSSLPPLIIDRGPGKRQVRPLFNAYSIAIVEEWKRRQQEPTGRQAESPNAFFKREAYRLLATYVAAGRVAVFRRFAQEYDWSERLIDEGEKNSFKLGLMAMFYDKELSRNNRLVFSNQMLYAWAHDVPPEFLNAFLGVSGSPAEIAQKLRAGHKEVGFEHRFKPERLLIPEASA